MIVVQSMDGKLQFFDQTAEAFSRQLVDCLIPGCIFYSRRLDAFVISNYACRVECYRYQVLVNAQADIGSSSTTKSSFGLTAVRSAMVEWSINLGESVLQILGGKILPSTTANIGTASEGEIRANTSAAQQSQEEILVICDWSLFLIKVCSCLFIV
jgi:hypothetical protein